MNETRIQLMALINQGLDRYNKAHAKYISGKGGLTFPTEAQYIAEVLIENGVRIPVLCENCKAFVQNSEVNTNMGDCYRYGLGCVRTKKVDDFCSCGEKIETDEGTKSK